VKNQVNYQKEMSNFFDDDKQGSMYTPIRIYSNDSPSIYDITEGIYNKLKFGDLPETKFFTSEQIQLVMPARYSDESWQVSDTVREHLHEALCMAIMQSNSTAEQR
jgi:hypothetical protein